MRRIRVFVALPALIIAFLVALPASTSLADRPFLAHGGGLNKCGCHHNRKTGECHCHRDRGCGCACQPARCNKKR